MDLTAAFLSCLNQKYYDSFTLETYVLFKLLAINLGTLQYYR